MSEPTLPNLAVPPAPVAEPQAVDLSVPTGGGPDPAPTTPAPAAAAETPRSRLEKHIKSLEAGIERSQIKLADAQNQLTLIDVLSDIDAGFAVSIRTGAGGRSVVSATVLAVNRTDPLNPDYRVYFGEGFEAETRTIKQGQIVAVLHDPRRS